MSNFYKIECEDTLKKIDDFFSKRDAFYSNVKKICDHFGFNHHNSTDSILFGIQFNNMCCNPNDKDIDKSLWKTSKIKNSHMVALLPRATAKEHKALYESMKPNPMDYSEISKLILKLENPLWTKSYGYRYKKGEYFMFETSLDVSSLAVEIVGSEYNRSND